MESIPGLLHNLKIRAPGSHLVFLLYQEVIYLCRFVFKAMTPLSPAYGYGSLALVMHSNEGGPGPRHNMKEDPGSSTLIMKREHGQGVLVTQGR